MKLTIDEIKKAFAIMDNLYPHVLPLSAWRAWEYAAYRRFRLPQGPILDLGCGDGHFFRLIWGATPLVDGVDLDAHAVKVARESDVYRRVYHTPAHRLPMDEGAYAAVFSNCALEHMNDIDDVLNEVFRILLPSGSFLFSAVTDHLVEWAPIRKMLASLGAPAKGDELWGLYEEYHNLVNPFAQSEWLARLEKIGFEVETVIPIVPETFARAFLFFDELWHVHWQETELGQPLHQYLKTLPQFTEGVQAILEGLWKLSPNHDEGAGLVVLAKKRKGL